MSYRQLTSDIIENIGENQMLNLLCTVQLDFVSPTQKQEAPTSIS